MFFSQALANIVNAFANAGIQDEALFSRMSAMTQEMPEDAYDTHAISNIVNAYARHGTRDDKLLGFLSKIAQKLPSSTYSVQSVSNCINGYAKLGCCDTSLLRFLSQTALQFPAKSFTAQDVACIVYGCSKCGISDKRLFAMLSDVAKQRKLTTAQAISNIVNAFSRISLGDAELYDHLLQEALNLSPLSERSSGANVGDASQSTEGSEGSAGANIEDARLSTRRLTSMDVALLLSSFDKVDRLDDTLIQVWSVPHFWSPLQGR